MKVVRELGLERRKTVRSLSIVIKRKAEIESSTRGSKNISLQFTYCFLQEQKLSF